MAINMPLVPWITLILRTTNSWSNVRVAYALSFLSWPSFKKTRISVISMGCPLEDKTHFVPPKAGRHLIHSHFKRYRNEQNFSVLTGLSHPSHRSGFPWKIPFQMKLVLTSSKLFLVKSGTSSPHGTLKSSYYKNLFVSSAENSANSLCLIFGFCYAKYRRTAAWKRNPRYRERLKFLFNPQ